MRHLLSCQNVGRDLSRTNGQITDYFECGTSSVGRARPCQGRGHEFEPRVPLQFLTKEIGVEIKIQSQRRKGLILTKPRTLNAALAQLPEC